MLRDSVSRGWDTWATWAGVMASGAGVAGVAGGVVCSELPGGPVELSYAQPEAASWTVDRLNQLFLSSAGASATPIVPLLKRGADPAHDLTWLLVGFDAAALSFHPGENFDFDVPRHMKEEALRVLHALQHANIQGFVLVAFREVCRLIALEHGQLPYGPVLGFLGQTGDPMAMHKHLQTVYFLPRELCDGSCPLTAMLQTGQHH